MEINYTGNKPRYMTEGAAGADLESSKKYVIMPGEQVMIDTGTSLELPEHTCGLLLPRSSLCNKKVLRLCNSVGLLDTDYRGTLKFVYKNEGDTYVVIPKGERIGQVLILPFVTGTFVKKDDLETTVRGEGGFGSTGK